LDGDVPAAQISGSTVTPGKLLGQAIYVFNRDTEQVGPIVGFGATPVYDTVYNDSRLPVASGLRRVVEIDGGWFVEVDAPGLMLVDLTDTIDGARGDDPPITMDSVSDVALLATDGASVVSTADSHDLYNPYPNLQIPRGVHAAAMIGSTLLPLPQLYRGLIEVEISDNSKFRADSAGEPCDVLRVWGPDDLYSPSPDPEQFDTINVDNPREIPGWKLLCGYNQMQESWEVVASNLGAGGSCVFPVRLQFVSGDAGGVSSNCSWVYDVIAVDVPRVVANSYSPAAEPRGYQRLARTKYELKASRGLGYFEGEDFILLSCNETLATQAYNMSGIPTIP
jgi:hypothetical protein